MTKRKIILTIAALLLLLIAIYVYKKSVKTTTEGEITLIVVDEEKVEVINQKVTFTIGDNLEKLLKDNFEEVTIKNKMLLGIEGVYADTKEYFLKIYINCVSASHGVSDIKLHDGDEIRIVYTKVGDFSAPC